MLWYHVLSALYFFKSSTALEIDGVPVSSPLECYRPCQPNALPKTCYYHFTLEPYSVLSQACQTCVPDNQNHFTANCQCILADGVEKILYSINRMYPGPSIQVCQNDTVVVDVRNRIEASGVTIHWHGLFQTDTPFYDGVPFITQCPIQDSSTFRYRFLAANEGTHFYHSHSGLQKLNGICGTLVVRQPKSIDRSGSLYDFDLQEHVIIITDWMHELAEEHFPGRILDDNGQVLDSILINGKGETINPVTGCRTTVSLHVFHVKPGHRYRFRFINAFATVAPSKLTIEGHPMKLIASDGIALKPEVVNSLISSSGERYDFVVETNQRPGSYWIQVKALEEGGVPKIHQLAILMYEGTSVTPRSPVPSYGTILSPGRIFNPFNVTECDTLTDVLCVSDLRSVEKSSLNRPAFRLYLLYKFHVFSPLDFYQPGTYKTALVAPDANIVYSLINNIRYENTASPLLTQYHDIPPERFCNENEKPTRCTNTTFCSCAHIYKAPLNSVVEIVLVDSVSVTNLSHPFHLHGGVFEVVALGSRPHQTTEFTLSDFLLYESRGFIKRNLHYPVVKDTVSVPFNGIAILRTKLTNPGFWYFHCHFLFHTVIGMNIVIQVGELDQMPEVPRGFPKCGDFLPSI